jgi:hypothetical protein
MKTEFDKFGAPFGAPSSRLPQAFQSSRQQTNNALSDAIAQDEMFAKMRAEERHRHT